MRCYMKKIILTLLVAFSLSVNTVQAKEAVAQEPNKEFTTFLDEQFTETIEDNYTTMHQYITDPKAYGIDVDKVDVTLGTLLPSDEDIQEIKDTQKELESFDYESLDKTQQEIYDEIDFSNELASQLYKDKYQYLTSVWNANSGIHVIFTSYFSEYVIHQESDIKDLITLINDVPNLTDEAISFSKKQAKEKQLMLNYDSVMDSINSTLDSKDESVVYTNLCAQVDNLGLDSKKADTYKKDIKKAMDKSFFPSFKKMKKELKKLKSSIINMQGLANRKNGKAYYELLVQQATGSDKSVDEIYEELNDEMDDSFSALQSVVAKNKKLDVDVKTDFTSAEEILSFLEANYNQSFPDIGKITYNVQPLSHQQSINGIVAYFVLPTIDKPTENQIRYNERDYGSDPTALDFYQTMAHEGIPGHMYQSGYNREHNTYKVQYLLSESGFSEGYATYVETRSLYYLNLDEDQITYLTEMSDLEHALICILDMDINYYGLSKKEIVKRYSDLLGEDGVESLYSQLCDLPSLFLSYYYGYFQIDELRSLAEKELGDKFDEKEFHNALLEAGSVNFSIVERNVNEYITNKKGE